MAQFWRRVWFGPLEPGWFNFFETASRRFAIFWPMVVLFSTTGTVFMTLCTLGCFLLSGRYAKKYRIIRNNPVALGAFLLGVLSLVGCLYTSAERIDMLKSLDHERNFFAVAMCITLFDKAFYREAAVMILHLAMPVLLGMKIYYMSAYGIESDQGLMAIIDYVTWGIIVVTWIALIIYRPFTWRLPWSWENDGEGSHDDSCGRKVKASDDSAIGDKPKWQRIGRLLLVFSLILFIFLTNRGRTVYLCLAGVSAVIFIQRFRWKEIAKAGVAFLILISIILACFPRVRERCEKAYREAVAFQADNTVIFSGEESSIGRRLFMYKYGLMTAIEHPLLGTGTGSVKGEFDRQIANLNRGSNSNWSGDTNDLHCEFLTMLMQYGVVGLIGYAIWLGTLWYYSTKIVWPWNMLGRCMAAMITISTIFSSHMSNVRTGCFYALMVALFFSAETRSEKNEESP